MLNKIKSLITNKKSKLSIDIGTKSIKIIEGKYDGGIVKVEKALEIETPPNSYYDGQIISKESLGQFIRQAIQDEKIKSDEVIFTIESNSIIIREIELPSVKDQDIKQMLEFEIEQYFPVNLDEYVVQSKIVDKIDSEEIKKSAVLILALPKIICEEYFNLINYLELKPLVLDTESNSIYNLLIQNCRINDDKESIEDKTVAILDIGFNTTNVIIIEHGKYKFNKLIEFGGKEIDMNIANQFNISLEEAEEKKLQINGLGQDEENDLLDIVKSIVQSSMDSLCIEIEKIFRFYTSRSPENRIDTIYTYGGVSNTKGVNKYIEDVFITKTFQIRKLSNVMLSKDYENIDMSKYLNATSVFARK